MYALLRSNDMSVLILHDWIRCVADVSDELLSSGRQDILSYRTAAQYNMDGHDFNTDCRLTGIIERDIPEVFFFPKFSKAFPRQFVILIRGACAYTVLSLRFAYFTEYGTLWCTHPHIRTTS